MPKQPILIDADKLLEWIGKEIGQFDNPVDNYCRGRADGLTLAKRLLESGAFGPTPVQPGDRVLHGIHGIGTVESEVYIPTPTVTVDFDKYVLLHSSPITELEVIKDE